MTDPYLYILLHKYKHIEHVKEAQKDRLVQSISHPSIQMQKLTELSNRMFRRWTTRRQMTPETPVIEGNVAMP
jgi:hypothetical protein